MPTRSPDTLILNTAEALTRRIVKKGVPLPENPDARAIFSPTLLSALNRGVLGLKDPSRTALSIALGILDIAAGVNQRNVAVAAIPKVSSDGFSFQWRGQWPANLEIPAARARLTISNAGLGLNLVKTETNPLRVEMSLRAFTQGLQGLSSLTETERLQTEAEATNLLQTLDRRNQLAVSRLLLTTTANDLHIR